MKFQPFSPSERPRIIRQVIAEGSWHGTRFGVPVTIKLDRNLIESEPIFTQCRIKPHTVASFRTENVTQAMDEVNRLIQSSGRRP